MERASSSIAESTMSPKTLNDSVHAPSLHEAEPADAEPAMPKQGKPFKFWMVFVALCFSCFLAALDLTAVSTTLPDIAETFQSEDYSWIGSAYALTSTAFVPWTGGLAKIFGRRPVMLAGLLLFALGSALAGAAQTMAMAIAGRAVQGVGGGAILTMVSQCPPQLLVSGMFTFFHQVEIIVCDLVPLAERGAYFGIIGSVWALASAIGPPIGGALASAGAWRWLFYRTFLSLCSASSLEEELTAICSQSPPLRSRDRARHLLPRRQGPADDN